MDNGELNEHYTYVVALLDDDVPRIVAVLPGHTVTLETIDADSKVYLAARYFAGGNQHVLSILDVEKRDLTPIPGPSLASNIRSIEINGSRISVQNQITGEEGVREVVKTEYKVEGGAIVAAH